MQIPNSPFSTENSINFPFIEDNIYVTSNLSSGDEIFNFEPNISDMDENENIDALLYFINPNRNNNCRINFRIELLKKKRGKKRKKGSKKAEHTSWNIDNIIVKVQTHFLNFVISFLNDCVHSFPNLRNQNIKFLKFDRREKNKVSKEQMNKMKNSTIKDLLEKVNISREYKQYDKNTNKKNLDALIKESCYLSENEFTKKNWFQQIFDMKFLDLFSYYYNNEQPLQEIKIFGKKIILSKKTESFIALLQKYEIMEDKIVKYTKEIYFDDVN